MGVQLNNAATCERNMDEYYSMFGLSDYDKGLRIAGFGDGPASFDREAVRREYKTDSFDLGLISHLLLMNTALGYDFHIRTIDEMLRVCREVRIYPFVDTGSEPSKMVSDVIGHYKGYCSVRVREADSGFQNNSGKVLVIRR